MASNIMEQNTSQNKVSKSELKDKLLHACQTSVFMKDALTNFDSRGLNEQIKAYANYVAEDNFQQLLPADSKQSHLGFMASELYDHGGHTPCLVNAVESFYQEYDISLFLTNKSETIARHGPKTMKSLSKQVQVKGIDFLNKQIDPEPYIVDLYNQIIASQVNTLFLYVHMYDFLAIAVCYLLQKNTHIKIILFNHGDHVKSIGLNCADLIIEQRPSGYQLTNEKRGYHNNIMIDLQSKKKDATTYYSQQEKDDFKQKHHLTKEFVAFTGCDYYKLFDNENESKFFTFVKDMLVKEQEIQYLIITDVQGMMNKHGDLIKRIFSGNEEAYSRLIMMYSIKPFDILFQSCDVFVDSFPQGSALTHIDCMRNKVPTILKINSQTPIKSFEFFLPKDYPYKFKNADDILATVSDFYDNRHTKNPIVEDMYNYFLQRYEFDVIKKNYQEIIELHKQDIPTYMDNWKQKHPMK